MKHLIYLSVPILLTACISRPAPPTDPVPQAVVAQAPVCEAEAFTVYFEDGETTLSEEAGILLDTVAKSFARCDVYKMEIEGHADASGAAETNQLISEARATAVREALHTRGVDAERVRIVAFGEHNATTSRGEAKPLNRKTEVRLIPEQEKTS